MAIGQNPTIKDGILRLETSEWLVPIKDTYPKLEADYLRLEPTQVLENKERTEVLGPVRLRWHARQDSNLQPLDSKSTTLSN